jgi:hypothetical protein
MQAECFNAIVFAEGFSASKICGNCYAKLSYQLSDIFYVELKYDGSFMIKCPCCDQWQYASFMTNEESVAYNKLQFRSMREGATADELWLGDSAESNKSKRILAWKEQYAETQTVPEPKVEPPPIKSKSWYQFW